MKHRFGSTWIWTGCQHFRCESQDCCTQSYRSTNWAKNECKEFIKHWNTGKGFLRESFQTWSKLLDQCFVSEMTSPWLIGRKIRNQYGNPCILKNGFFFDTGNSAPGLHRCHGSRVTQTQIFYWTTSTSVAGTFPKYLTLIYLSQGCK